MTSGAWGAKAIGPVLAGFFAVVAITGGYGYLRLEALGSEVRALSSELASTTSFINASLSEATTSLSAALEKERQSIQAELGGVQEQVGSIRGSVTTLEKLTTTDPEFLAKYSKVFFLSENYAPARLVDIPDAFKYTEQNSLQVIPQVLPYLEKMIRAAKDDEVDLYVLSAYRSFSTQETLKGQYRVTYGAGSANAFSADQGYSEHQLGTTVDFVTTGTNGSLQGFDKQPAYPWLLENAHRYGFILSYPQGNSYYVFEPWHWRFVGIKLATDLHKSAKAFYDLDQRAIDAYLPSLFD